jgi:hypothetical protein
MTKKEIRIQTINAYSTAILAGATIILVIITGIYAYQTFKLSNISAKQMLLSAEPNIDLESDNCGNINKIETGKVRFQLVNLSPVDLKNIRLSSKYCTHLIDSKLNEYTLLRGIKTILPDFEIKRIKGNVKIPIEFDYKRSGLTGKDDAYYYIGIPPSVKRYSISDIINNFSTLTYAEYRIDFQREIDGRDYSRSFCYLIALTGDLLIRQTSKEDILNQNRETAVNMQLLRSGN